MAERRGSGGRGGVATDAPAFNLEDFQPVKTEEKISRSATQPSAYRPLVELALANMEEYIEHRQPAGEDGTREPVTYSKDEAQQLFDNLRAAADQMKLPASRRSLRIVTLPKLSEAKDDDRIRVQWYVIRLKSASDGKPTS
jgi:hypothetical protein